MLVVDINWLFETHCLWHFLIVTSVFVILLVLCLRVIQCACHWSHSKATYLFTYYTIVILNLELCWCRVSCSGGECWGSTCQCVIISAEMCRRQSERHDNWQVQRRSAAECWRTAGGDSQQSLTAVSHWERGTTDTQLFTVYHRIQLLVIADVAITEFCLYFPPRCLVAVSLFVGFLCLLAYICYIDSCC